MAFLVLYAVGLGTMIVVCVALGMWDLVVINSLVFLMLAKLEMVLCRARYTVPMPVYADGTVGAAPECVTVEPQAEKTSVEAPEPMITRDFGVTAA